ncbi:MAG TPA: hypothetical protein VEH30_04100 [Terriglobales bacterium]|nr:hypothetical protein [Terriglobales bacterium]
MKAKAFIGAAVTPCCAPMKLSRKMPLRLFFKISIAVMSVGFAYAQTCFTAADMDEPTRNALQNTGKRYLDMVSRGDSASLKQSATPSLAADFSAVENALNDSQAALTGAQATSRPPYLLKVEGTTPLQRAEFLCGVFGKSGQTANSAEFVIPNLAPGNYGIVVLDASGPKPPRTVSFVLQQQAADWKIAGFYLKDLQVKGHEGNWFADKARAFKSKGQNHNAWFYYLEARELSVPLPFMYTQITDNLYDESQAVKPTDLPVDGTTVDLVAAGKTYKLTTVFPLAVGDDFDLVVKYQSADVSDAAKTFQENTAVMKGLLARLPELADAFDGIVARAVEPSGRDYGSMLPMKDIK